MRSVVPKSRSKPEKGWHCPRPECGSQILWRESQLDIVRTEGQWYVETSCPACRAWLRISKQGVRVIREPGFRTAVIRKKGARI
jgi:predicted RNA-binding Zn-ribbon protein involved in translation (DUF1610 family)